MRMIVTIDIQIVKFCANRLLGLHSAQEVIAYNFDEAADVKARAKLAGTQLSSSPV